MTQQQHPMGAPAQQRTGGLDWFYNILDVERGVDMAVRDAQRVTTWQAAAFGLVINGILLVAFFGIWLRYDLWSTMTVFAPVRDSIMEAVPNVGAPDAPPAIEGAAPQTDGPVRTAVGFTLGIAAAFFTSLVQWAYPRLSREHDAAMWALAAASIFDIATDYPDVKKDFPIYFKGVIDMINAQPIERWLGVAAICFVVGLILHRQRSLMWFLAGLSGACALLPVFGITTSVIWEWGIVFVATIFCSFVAQSLVIIHAAKLLALFSAFKAQRTTAQRVY